jgi:hypothetical protein
MIVCFNPFARSETHGRMRLSILGDLRKVKSLVIDERTEQKWVY